MVVVCGNGDVTLNGADVGVGGVNATVDHGDLDTLTAAAAPGPVRSDRVHRAASMNGDQTAVMERSRVSGTDNYHELAPCPPDVSESPRKNTTKFSRIPLHAWVASSPFRTISCTSRARSRASR